MDYTVFHAINRLAGHLDFIDDLMESISQYAPFALIAFLLALWFWPGAQPQREIRQWACITAVVSASLALGVAQIIIRIWDRPRPFADHHVVLLLKPSADPSFPSDHAIFAFAVAVAIYLAHRRAGQVALGIAAVLAVSRVYVGEHYASDVLAGPALGSLVAIGVYHLHDLARPLIGPPLRLARRVHLA